MLVGWDTHAVRYTENGTQWGAEDPWSRVLGEWDTHAVQCLESWVLGELGTHAVGCLGSGALGY